MISWICPHCGESMHSAWDKRDDEVVVCISCGGTFKNKYYRKKEEEARERSLESDIKHH